MNLDTSIQYLVKVMNNAFIFMHEAAHLDHSAIYSQKDILACMAKQATECAYFIRDYARNKSFCALFFPQYPMTLICPTGLRTAKNLVSDVDSKVKQYEETFNQLLSLFRDRAALQTEITVFETKVTILRILGDVKDLGEQFCY